MFLSHLSISRLRNIESASLKPACGPNLLVGENGSGKTSILESINVLSQGRSFRVGNNKGLIQHTNDDLLILGELSENEDSTKVGVEISKSGSRARINKQPVKTLTELSNAIPVQSIHPASFTLLNGEPSNRRSFLDWGVFFEQPQFGTIWKRYKTALSQRNAALRNGLSPRDIVCWDKEICQSGEKIAELRSDYFSRLQERLLPLLNQFEDFREVQFVFGRGWSRESSLAELLVSGLDRDRKLGYTYCGSHRGDFRIKVDGADIAQFGSRGQIKRIILLLKMAQILLFIDLNGNRCILLIDDLLSEFDDKNVQVFVKLFRELKLQSFITSASSEEVNSKLINPEKMFHVKHGSVQEMV